MSEGPWRPQQGREEELGLSNRHICLHPMHPGSGVSGMGPWAGPLSTPRLSCVATRVKLQRWADRPDGRAANSSSSPGRHVLQPLLCQGGSSTLFSWKERQRGWGRGADSSLSPDDKEQSRGSPDLGSWFLQMLGHKVPCLQHGDQSIMGPSSSPCRALINEGD